MQLYDSIVYNERKKQPVIISAVNLAKGIKSRSQSVQALAGILTFSDKIIDKAYQKRIKEEMQVTQIGQMLIDEGIEKGIEALILDNREENKTDEQILTKLVKRFSLSREEALMYLKRYSKQG